jgi:hypothetical protein
MKTTLIVQVEIKALFGLAYARGMQGHNLIKAEVLTIKNF